MAKITAEMLRQMRTKKILTHRLRPKRHNGAMRRASKRGKK